MIRLRLKGSLSGSRELSAFVFAQLCCLCSLPKATRMEGLP